MTRTTRVLLTAYELELFAYHLSAIFLESGHFGLSCRAGLMADVQIAPSAMSATDGAIWDSVTINGHSVGNRHGGAKAYARMTAGDPAWWEAR